MHGLPELARVDTASRELVAWKRNEREGIAVKYRMRPESSGVWSQSDAPSDRRPVRH
jgi:hypothetical protein